MAEKKSFKDVLKAVQKAGLGDMIRTVQDLGETTRVMTGTLMLDLALWGGLPRGQQVEFIGRFSSGKTFNALLCVASFMAAFPDMKVLWIDKEGTLKLDLAELLGIDLSFDVDDEGEVTMRRFLIARPASGENVSDLVDEALGSEDIGMIVVDSIPAMMAQQEMDKSADEHVMALHAKLVGRMATKTASRLIVGRNQERPHEPIVLYVNQWRAGVGGQHAFKSRPGGNAYPYFLHDSIEFANKEAQGNVGNLPAKVTVANDYTFESLKNKDGNTCKVGAFSVNRDPTHARGIGFVDQSSSILTWAKIYGLLVPAGSKGATLLPFGVTRKMEAKPSLVEWLDERPGCSAWLRMEIVSRHREAFKKSRTGWMAGLPPVPEEPFAKEWQG